MEKTLLFSILNLIHGKKRVFFHVKFGTRKKCTFLPCVESGGLL